MSNNNNIINVFIRIKRPTEKDLDIFTSKDIECLIKYNILEKKGKYYNLTFKGKVVMNDNIYYNSRKICEFIYKKYI